MIRRVILLARTDLRLLFRNRFLAVGIVLYPLIMAALIGGLLLNQGKPKVAFVNEDLTSEGIEIGPHSFSLSTYVKQAQTKGVDVVSMPRSEAERALADGQVTGVLIIPAGTGAQLRTQLSGAKVKFLTGKNALGDVVAQRMRGVVYSINLEISQALIDTNREYLQTLVEGGAVVVQGREYALFGLDPVSAELQAVQSALKKSDPELAQRIGNAVEFATSAGSAIRIAEKALEATAAPIRLSVERQPGASPLLTAQALSFALAVLVTFVAVTLISSLLAGEYDSMILARLLRGVVTPFEVIAGKLVTGAVLGVLFSTGLFVVFALLAPQAWPRLPLLLVGVIFASLFAASIGTLLAVIVRDARVVSLIAILLIIPLAPLAIIHVDNALGWLLELTPVRPARVLFNALLFETDPWRELGVRAAQLIALSVACSLVSARLLRRLI